MKLVKKKVINKPQDMVYIIKREINNKGEENYIPYCGTLHYFGLVKPQFERIVKIYDQYHLLDVDINKKLTQQEALDHIEGYKQQLIIERGDDVTVVETFQA